MLKEHFWDDDAAAWPSPAKLNLFLHINGQRDDGYHLLQTHFIFLDYGDSLYFEINETGDIALDWPSSDVNTQDNLIYKAAKAIQSAALSKYGASIKVTKRIPMGAGVGGGSSNAATTLVALNYLWKAGLSIDQLADIGVELGADVPVFVRGQAAWAEGIGEHLSPINSEEKSYLVVFPPCSVSTAAVFGDKDLPRNTAIRTLSEYESAAIGFGNDCEELVFRKYPEIKNTAERMKEFGEPCLTGTGSSLFLEVGDIVQMIEQKDKLKALGNFVITKGRNLSPLFARIRALR